MPRPLFCVRNRAFFVHLVVVWQMTFSSFMAFLYGYLSLLENLTGQIQESKRVECKSWMFSLSCADFLLGMLLGFGINQKTKKQRRGKLLLWIYIETISIPVHLYMLLRFQEEFADYNHVTFREFYSNISIAYISYIILHIFFVFFIINYMAYHEEKIKQYDPTKRPAIIYAPTDPEITTTESRHIRFSNSIMMFSSSNTNNSK